MANSPQALAYKMLMDTFLEEFVDASKAVGEPLTSMAAMVKKAFQAQMEFIVLGLTRPKPDDATLNQLIVPLSDALREVQQFRDRNRAVQEYFNHLSTVSESIVALSWIGVSPTPCPFIKDMRDAGQYFGNRVLSQHKGNALHSNWIAKWNEVLNALEQYVRTHHLTGFTWGAAGQTAQRGGAPPPPPPPLGIPPPPPPPSADLMGGGGDDSLRNALFNEINQGDSITRILKPVQRGVKSSQASAPIPGAPSVYAQVPQKVTPPQPPKFVLEGRKWKVEYQKNNLGMVINTEDMSESLAMYKCEDSSLHVQNKMNGITVDNCKRLALVCSDIISSVDVIRCDRLKIQCTGHVPLISLDNCDSIQIFVTEASSDVEIISSKCTSCNVCILAPDGDYVELPMPEQIKTVLKKGVLHSSIVEKV